MSYRVRFEGAALVQLNGLPALAFDALVERVVDLVDEPCDASVMPPGDDHAFRTTVFDAGNGLLSFYADDIAEIIRIFDITWIGSRPPTRLAESSDPATEDPTIPQSRDCLSSILTGAGRLRALGAIHSLVTDDGPGQRPKRTWRGRCLVVRYS